MIRLPIKGPDITVNETENGNVTITMTKEQAKHLYTMVRHLGGRTFNFLVTDRLNDAFRTAGIQEFDRTEYLICNSGQALYFELPQYVDESMSYYVKPY